MNIDFSFAEHLHLQFVKMEDEVLRNVLFELLKRPVTSEDAKDCTMVYREGITNEYELLYKGKQLGRIIKTCDNINFKVEFIPNQ